MQHLGYVFVAVGFLLAAAGASFLYVGQEIIRHPGVTTRVAVTIDPEPARLLKRLYEIRTRYDLHKLIVGRNGSISKSVNGIPEDINLTREILGRETVDDSAERALEKLFMQIPFAYVRHLPESRWDSPYVVSVTPEGVEFLRTGQ